MRVAGVVGLAIEGTRVMRTFLLVLGNSLVANTTTNMVWFGLMFWAYLSTRSVLVTSLLGGMYMLLVSALSIPFGILVDRLPKKLAMSLATSVSTVAFAVAWMMCQFVSPDALIDMYGWAFWALATVVLLGAVAGSVRDVALATCVSILVPSEDRPKANGWVGIVQGVGFSVNTVTSGLIIGYLGLRWLLGLGAVLIALSLVHLVTIRLVDPVFSELGEELPRARLVQGLHLARTVPGLMGLIAFSTLNNLLAGVYLGLLDPYGLQLVSVQQWGAMYTVLSVGFVIGGALIQKTGLGINPVRTLLSVNLVMWALGTVMTIRESILLLAMGIVLFMVLATYAEAAEQTVMQKVVPFREQGRVFGFALAVERLAVPVSTFIVGPLAEFWVMPYMDSDAGRQAFGWLLGEGTTRGIALVFMIASASGLLLIGLAFLSQPYAVLSRTYADASVNDCIVAPGAGT